MISFDSGGGSDARGIPAGVLFLWSTVNPVYCSHSDEEKGISTGGYQPAPLDTRDVVLDAGLRELLESLAKQAHEAWAQMRLAEGWRFGPRRDEQRKEHPCLVPYEDLPESEKDVDRATAEQILKSMIALGYRVTKN